MTDASKLADDDHARGCEGRCYTCTCGYDDRVDAALRERDTFAAENARLREEVERFQSDHVRCLRRDDVRHVCPNPDLCFEYTDRVRCSPCAGKQAEHFGIETDWSLPKLPQVSKLQRENATLRAHAAELAGALEPFKREWDDMGMPDDIPGDSLMLDVDPGGEILTVGHWRSLMAAYAKHREMK